MDSQAVLDSLVLEDERTWGEAATDWQKEDAAAVLSGQPPFHFLTRPRGGSKTTDQAGIALALLCAEAPAGTHSYCFAADRDQAGLLLDALSGFVRRTPGLDKLVKVDRWSARSIRNGADLTVMPADGPGTFGLRPWFVAVDELSVWPGDTSHHQVWEAVITAMGKVPGARLVVITNAGAPDHWSAKELDTARSSPYWRVREVDGPLPWTDAEYLEEMQRRLPPSTYARRFLNQWVASEDRLTTPAMLSKLVRHPRPLPPEEGQRYWIALDVGVVNDRTVATVGHRIFVGPREDRVAKLVIDRMQVWQGSKVEPVDLAQVEEWVAASSALYNGAVVVFDPHQAAQLTQGLRRRGIGTIQQTFNQQTNAQMALALYRLISGNLIELPADPALDEELLRVQIRETGPGLIRLDHATGQHDDRAVTLGMLAVHFLAAPTAPRSPRMQQVNYVGGTTRAHREMAAWLRD